MCELLFHYGVHNELVYNKSQELMDELAVEAFKESLVHTKARIVEGDAGNVICREAERLKPAAVIIGTRGRSLIQREVSVSIASTTVKQHQLSLSQAKRVISAVPHSKSALG
uniref:UspA domain-containing protein n=1 Tax=Aegilops tauschii TaxID=37682 RepID=R7WE38_AEGTA